MVASAGFTSQIKERAKSVPGIGFVVLGGDATLQGGAVSLQACQLLSIERRSSEDQVKTRWDETHFLQPLGPSLPDVWAGDK